MPEDSAETAEDPSVNPMVFTVLWELYRRTIEQATYIERLNRRINEQREDLESLREKIETIDRDRRNR